MHNAWDACFTMCVLSNPAPTVVSVCPSAALEPCMFFSPFQSMICGSCEKQDFGPVLSFLLGGVKYHCRDTGTGCSIMTVVSVQWLSGSARTPHQGPVWTIWLVLPELKGGKGGGGLVLGCFCWRSQAYRKAAHSTPWLVSVCVCCPSSGA